MKSSDLFVSILGLVDISYNGMAIHISRRVERGIFYYLLLENRMISREMLIDLLWPDAENVNPRGLLRTALSRLHSQMPDKDMLIRKRNQVGLDCSRCLVDLVKFEESYHSLGNILSAFPENKILPIQIFNQIKESLDLWHGDEILQGEDFSDYPELELWRQTRNREAQSHRLFLQKRLAEHYYASGQLDQALHALKFLFSIIQTDRSLQVKILDIYTKQGKYQETIEFCDSLEIIYEREFNAPLPEEILNYCQKAQKLIYPHDQDHISQWPISSLLDIPLVGRKNELAELKQIYYRGGMVKLNGELGSGKTRLAQALFETTSPKPFLVIASAKEDENSLPFAPIISGIRQFIPEDVLKEIDNVWANHLFLLLPELANFRVDFDIKIAQKLPIYRQHLLESIYQLFLLASKKYGRILFLLDDAHWADNQTLQTVSYLASRGLFEQNGLLIISSNSEYPQQTLQKTINQLSQSQPIHTITLPAFNPDEIRILIQSVINQPPKIDFVERMYNATGGNPLMVLSTLWHMLETLPDIESFMQTDPLPLPENIYKNIRSLINGLTADARQVLTIASLIGNEVPIKLLQSASELQQSRFLPALDLLIQTGFIYDQTINYSDERYIHFVHNKVRDIISKDISFTSWQILHQKLAILLSQPYRSNEQAAIIAEHYLHAGDLIRAFKWFLKAADYAWSLASREEASAAFIKAEEILVQSQKGEFDREHYLQLYDKMSKFAYQSSQISLLEEIGVKVQQFSAQYSDSELIGLANLSFAYACFFRDNFETGLMLTQNTLDRLDRKRHPELLIRTLYYRATFQWWTLDIEGVLTSKEKMKLALEEVPVDDPNRKSLQFLILALQGNIDYAKGNTKSFLSVSEEINREYFDDVGVYDRLLIYYNLSRSNYLAGNISECISFANEAVKMSQALENKYHEIFNLNNLSKYELIYGYLDEAYKHANMALNLAESVNNLQEAASASTLLGDLHGFLNNYPQAFHHYRIAQIRQGYSFQQFNALENHIHLARWLTRNNQLPEAKQIIKECLKVTEQKGISPLYLQALMADGLIDIKEKQVVLAKSKFEEAIEHAEKKDLAMDICWGKIRLVQLAIEEKNYIKAEELLNDILDFASEKNLITILKQAFVLAADLYKNNALQMSLKDLQSIYGNFIVRLEAHTQSEPLRKLFLKVHTDWQNENPFFI